MEKMESGPLPVIEYRLFDKNGQIKYVRTGGRVVKNKNGKHVTGTVHDITDYVLIRQQLSRNEQALQTIIECDRDGISVFDNNLNCIMWNQRSSEIYGKPRSEALAKNLFDLIPMLRHKNIDALTKQIVEDDSFLDENQHTVETDDSIIELIRITNISDHKPGVLVITRQKISDQIENRLVDRGQILS